MLIWHQCDTIILHFSSNKNPMWWKGELPLPVGGDVHCSRAAALPFSAAVSACVCGRVWPFEKTCSGTYVQSNRIKHRSRYQGFMSVYSWAHSEFIVHISTPHPWYMSEIKYFANPHSLTRFDSSCGAGAAVVVVALRGADVSYFTTSVPSQGWEKFKQFISRILRLLS